MTPESDSERAKKYRERKAFKEGRPIAPTAGRPKGSPQSPEAKAKLRAVASVPETKAKLHAARVAALAEKKEAANAQPKTSHGAYDET